VRRGGNDGRDRGSVGLSLRKGEECDVVVVNVRTGGEEGATIRCRGRGGVESWRRVDSSGFLTEVERRGNGGVGSIDFATVIEILVRVDGIDCGDQR
jgi:hypothetical protein